MTYYEAELAAQIRFREEGGFAPGSEAPGMFMGALRPFVFEPAWSHENLYAEPKGAEPTARDALLSYFQPIGWHRASAHLLSSQVCCVNFLGLFLHRPEALSALLAPLFDGQAPAPLKLPNEPGYIAFEWIGERDYLNEQVGERPRMRGANCTSVDAACLVEVEGRRELILIEWKYVERYGARLSGGERARRIRERRYADLAFAPCGPIRSDQGLWLPDFFYEPFYQLLRQQMLAAQLERDHAYGCDRVRVIHVSPADNAELGRITSPELRRRVKAADVFDLWPKLLVRSEAFQAIKREALFGPFPAERFGLEHWRAYLEERYRLKAG